MTEEKEEKKPSGRKKGYKNRYKRESMEQVSIRLPGHILKWLRSQGRSMGRVIEDAIDDTFLGGKKK